MRVTTGAMFCPLRTLTEDFQEVGKRMDIFWMIVVAVAYVVLMRFVLPRLGVPT
ncbi:MAG: hypothetical protein ACUVTG_16455 [Candidatus Oleimicrobiaceae bacterium]